MRPRIQRRELADFELGLWRLFFEIRILSLGALGLFSLLPFIEVDRIVVLFVLGLAVPTNIAMRELLPRLRFVPWWMPFGDAVMGATAIAIQPELAPIVLIVMLGSSSQAATAGWRPTILATLLGAPLLFAASARYDLAEGMTQIVAYLSVSLGITVFVAVIANAEREGRESREDLLDGIDAIVWRPIPIRLSTPLSPATPTMSSVSIPRNSAVKGRGSHGSLHSTGPKSCVSPRMQSTRAETTN